MANKFSSKTGEATKLLAIRMPEAEKRRIKSLAASQGLSLQEAVQQAMEAWVARLQAEGAMTFDVPAIPATTELHKPGKRERATNRS